MRDVALGPLLASTRSRLKVAILVVMALWAAVLWAVLAPDAPPASEPSAAPLPRAMRLVVASGQPAPGGGAFDRFDVAAQPIAAPVNADGWIAFYSSVVRSNAREGIFLATGSRIL